MREVVLYGILVERAGCATLTLALDEPMTVAQAVDAVAAAVPSLADELPRTACAVGDQLLHQEQPLPPHGALVLLPPVSGG